MKIKFYKKNNITPDKNFVLNYNYEKYQHNEKKVSFYGIIVKKTAIILLYIQL